MRDGKTIGLGMAGERQSGSGDWATLDDRFDVASCSKSITATIAAMLAERGVVGRIVERSIHHGGFSGRFRANIWFSPESRTRTVIVYYHGGDDKAAAHADIFYALLQDFGLRKQELR